MKRCIHWTLKGTYANSAASDWKLLGEYSTRAKAEVAATELLVYDRDLLEVQVAPYFSAAGAMSN